MEATELIKSFCEAVGIGYEPDADGTCTFDADGLEVSLVNLPELDAVALVGDLGEPPPERLEGLYKAMLEANHLFHGTAGATISLNSETGHFALCRPLLCKLMTAESFYKEVEGFLSTLETWTKLIANYREAAASPDHAAEMDFSSGLQGHFIPV